MTQTYMIKPEVAWMKQRLATSQLLGEAELMGFEIEITLPKDSLIPVYTEGAGGE